METVVDVESVVDDNVTSLWPWYFKVEFYNKPTAKIPKKQTGTLFSSIPPRIDIMIRLKYLIEGEKILCLNELNFEQV